MLSVADVLRRHGPAYVERYGEAVPSSHRRAMAAVTRCRTPALGGHLADCETCGHEHVLFHSCRHRACPRCGFDAGRRWIERQRDLLLPVPYFHVVFTVPAELRRVVRARQHCLIGVLFRSAFDSLAALCRDPHFLGGSIGAIAVLHTWSRTLEWHPHIHMLVPAGGLAADGSWLSSPRRNKRYLVPQPALAAGFRGRFLKLARQARVTLPPIPNKRWVVFAKPVVQGPSVVLEYLGRYIHRTALSDKAIVHCDDQSVSFRYKDSSDGKRKTMTLPGHEFVRRFLQHVPRKGLHRVRAFGLLHPIHRDKLQELQLSLSTRTAPAAPDDDNSTEDLFGFCSAPCPHCHQRTLRRGKRLSALECCSYLLVVAHASEQARAPPTESDRCHAA